MHRQLSLFDADNAIISQIAGFDSLLKASMNRAAAASPYSREQIVERMNALSLQAGRKLTGGNAKNISLPTLEKWLNPESDQLPPTRAVNVFMHACGTLAPLEAWAGGHGAGIMTPKDKKLRDLAEKKLTIQRAAAEARRLETQLKEEL
ncbi:MAG: hypothetical protein LBQ51_05585 [Desulfovibrio sp.]|nr:hypothetical protein [Desulfovibrio sp.]